MKETESTATTVKTRIADLSNDDKPREKALRSGIKSLSNAELLAIIFGGGIPGKSVVDLSRDMLSSVGNSLTTLARMSIGQVSRSYKGIGPAKAIALAAAFELGMRCRDENLARGYGRSTRRLGYAGFHPCPESEGTEEAV